MSTRYPKGAVWRKWDLHVHTPYSIYQKFGANNDDTWKKYISDLEDMPAEFAVIGINDYLFLDGYKKLCEEQENNKRLQNLTLFPVKKMAIAA